MSDAAMSGVIRIAVRAREFRHILHPYTGYTPAGEEPIWEYINYEVCVTIANRTEMWRSALTPVGEQACPCGRYLVEWKP